MTKHEVKQSKARPKAGQRNQTNTNTPAARHSESGDALAELSVPTEGIDSLSTGAQVQPLSNPQFQELQRQSIARQIGQTQGNTQLRQLIGQRSLLNDARPLARTNGSPHHTARSEQRSDIIQRDPVGETWRELGNLTGNPPVRDEERPPNKAIPEYESVYRARLAAARSVLARQRARAAAMLDKEGNVTDNRYWFAKVYSYVTEGEIEEVEKGTYYYPSYVLQSVKYFEQIYADNVQAANEGGTVEQHWQQAFEVAAENKGITGAEVLGGVLGNFGGGLASGMNPAGFIGGAALGAAVAEAHDTAESLVASMLAHIRFDLPRAEAWVFNTYYQGLDPSIKLADFRADFMSMTGVFDRAAEKMNAEIADHVGIPVDMMPRLMQDTSMKYYFEGDMATERADTWARAEELASSGLAEADPYTETSSGDLSGNVTEANNLRGLQKLPTEGLRPVMGDPAAQQSDTDIREAVAGDTSLATAQKPATERIRLIRRLCQGVTFDDDEATVINILEASQDHNGERDVATVIDGASAWDILFAADGDEYETLRQFFRVFYYINTSQSMALTLIRRCMDGETSEWEEAMIADILVDRYHNDGHAIIRQIGAIYENGGFADGLNKIQWQLDLSDQDRVDTLYAD